MNVFRVIKVIILLPFLLIAVPYWAAMMFFESKDFEEFKDGMAYFFNKF